MGAHSAAPPRPCAIRRSKRCSGATGRSNAGSSARRFRGESVSGEGVTALAPLALQATIGNQRDVIALPAILAAAARPRAAVRVVNVVAGAGFGSAAGHREGRGVLHQEPSPAYGLATRTTRVIAPGFDGDTVKALLPASGPGRARRCEYEPESCDSEADCYCYCAYQHGTHRMSAGPSASTAVLTERGRRGTRRRQNLESVNQRTRSARGPGQVFTNDLPKLPPPATLHSCAGTLGRPSTTSSW